MADRQVYGMEDNFLVNGLLTSGPGISGRIRRNSNRPVLMWSISRKVSWLSFGMSETPLGNK